jgi:very-short-patch-repair endonuclease
MKPPGIEKTNNLLLAAKGARLCRGVDGLGSAFDVVDNEPRPEDYSPPFLKGGQGGFVGGLPFKRNLQPLARELRKNMTEAERYLWARIRGKQLKNLQFYRQKNVAEFIVDFYCPAAKLILEVDGGQHYEAKGREKDSRRDAYFSELGFTVLRFSDREVFKNIDGVLERIWDHINKSPLTPL